ncbi:pentapeptide repeat-containing protein [Nocardia gipuzkoensis]
MSEGGTPESSGRGLGSLRRRSTWLGLVVMVGGGAAAFGIANGFSQPLATFLAGTGAVIAGALAYLNGQHSRDQAEIHHKADIARDRERHREDAHRARESALRDRYTAVAAQIAHGSAAIRQAGVYALAALADDWHAFGEDDERQVCINLLQWYLRVPFPEADNPEKPDLSEREIRQTILAILTQRRRRPADDPKSWASTSVSLHQVSLPKCNLSDFDLARLSVYSANLNSADLRGVRFLDADLRHADLGGANLLVANLSGAGARRAILDGAILRHAILRGADLSNATLNDTTLIGADLREAVLRDAMLRGADLRDADLRDADLCGAILNGANLRGAKLKGMRHIESTQWPAGFAPPK